MMDTRIAERQKVYEQHWDELINTVRAWRSDIADQIVSLALLRFASNNPGLHDENVVAVSNVFSDKTYPSPKSVIVAVLKSLGGVATRREICIAALAGGWRNPGGKKPYYDVWDSIGRLAKPRDLRRGNLIIRMLDEETVELID